MQRMKIRFEFSLKAVRMERVAPQPFPNTNWLTILHQYPNFQDWFALLEESAQVYANCPVDSCSVNGHECAQMFHYFIHPYLTGAVLDVGCGPQPVPSYLQGYPHDHIAGVDPISGNHPFVFALGTGEYLPWPDESFDHVIVATSLDHVLDIDRVLCEIRRVLVPRGEFLLWSSFEEGAEEYWATVPRPRVDHYHMFHLDKSWFDRRVQGFSLVEEIEHFDNTFRCYRKTV